MADRRKKYLIVQHVAATNHGLYAGVGCSNSGRPLLALHSREKAIGEAERLEREARKVLPPFHVSRPEKWSSLGLVGLVARLQELGLRDLPDPKTVGHGAARLFRHWWDEHGGELSAEQVEAVWELLDLVELYQVVEVPAKG